MKSVKRVKKIERVGTLSSALEQNSMLIILKNKGISVPKMKVFRRSLVKVSANCIFLKNSLAKIALGDEKYSQCRNFLSGTTVGVFTNQNNVDAVKFIVDFANSENVLSVVGGYLGAATYSAEEILAFSKLPNVDGMRAKLLSVMLAPHSKFVRVLSAPLASFVRVLQRKSEQ
ncbi:50S ribosomal protein L10 [Candidatus Fokinia crypta]|uniref:Large ribosomal subunit protein uL10 n=1 Tax=Candidatus Fokinia crypta TaxID=1920990 RepID=A0ABZ0UNZ6_9RICK|nr:50S ribosomal protein L10 [Candidatus Fokinia cryptica]WPX97839.1 50S ribosomal protein L10 [Candidatus Fokinia cryptica]